MALPSPPRRGVNLGAGVDIAVSVGQPPVLAALWPTDTDMSTPARNSTPRAAPESLVDRAFPRGLRLSRMDHSTQVALLRRIFAFLDAQTTELAPAAVRERRLDLHLGSAARA